jgi:hypothetical protein
MQRSAIARAFWALTIALAVTATAPPAAGAQSPEQITICQPTGSAMSPWVLMIIDTRLWPEYQARGARRAGSLADCAEPTPVATQAPPAVAFLQQPTVQATPVAAATLPAATPTAAPASAVVVATPVPTVEVAGATASQSATPEVTTLPQSGEPDRLPLVLGFTALALIGTLLRRFARGAR